MSRFNIIENGVVVNTIVASIEYMQRKYDPSQYEQLPDIPKPEKPDPVPQSVTMRQARLALLQQGLLAQVDTVIDQLPEPDKSAAKIEWEYSQTVERDRPLIQALAPGLGLSDEDLDNLFKLAVML
jgi:predicted component of type VI protein secretion system